MKLLDNIFIQKHIEREREGGGERGYKFDLNLIFLQSALSFVNYINTNKFSRIKIWRITYVKNNACIQLLFQYSVHKKLQQFFTFFIGIASTRIYFIVLLLPIFEQIEFIVNWIILVLPSYKLKREKEKKTERKRGNRQLRRCIAHICRCWTLTKFFSPCISRIILCLRFNVVELISEKAIFPRLFPISFVGTGFSYYQDFH